MITQAAMEATARNYLRAARILIRRNSSSPDVAVYLCGYVTEIALKACIVVKQGMPGFPETDAEFAPYRAYKTHRLDRLLGYSGQEASVKGDPILLADWSTVQLWNPEQRYAPVGTQTIGDARDMVEATVRLLAVLL